MRDFVSSVVCILYQIKNKTASSTNKNKVFGCVIYIYTYIYIFRLPVLFYSSIVGTVHSNYHNSHQSSYSLRFNPFHSVRRSLNWIKFIHKTKIEINNNNTNSNKYNINNLNFNRQHFFAQKIHKIHHHWHFPVLKIHANILKKENCIFSVLLQIVRFYYSTTKL